MKKRWVFLLLLLIFAGAGYYYRGKAAPGDAAARPKGKEAVPVVLATAEQKNVPIWLTGLGTAQAPNTVTVRPRVSGALDSVNFTEGALVNVGDVLARIDPRPYESALAQAEAKKMQDDATLANAKLDATRYEELKMRNAVSQQQLDQAKANLGQLEGLVKADQAAVDAAMLDLDFTTIRAPISGRTGIRLLDAGNLVTANQAEGLVVLTEMGNISVIFTIPQQHLSTIRRNMQPGAEPLVVQARSQDGQMLGDGRLELMDNQVDVSTGTLRLKATFPNEKLTIWPGQFLTIRLLVETRRNVVVVASGAVKAGLEGQFCYVVKDDDTVEARNVKTGPETDEGTVIEEGIKAGERVVTIGQNKLTPGVKVSPQKDAP